MPKDAYSYHINSNASSILHFIMIQQFFPKCNIHEKIFLCAWHIRILRFNASYSSSVVLSSCYNVVLYANHCFIINSHQYAYAFQVAIFFDLLQSIIVFYFQAEYSCIASKSKRVMWLYNEDACIISTNALPKKHEPIIM